MKHWPWCNLRSSNKNWKITCAYASVYIFLCPVLLLKKLLLEYVKVWKKKWTQNLQVSRHLFLMWLSNACSFPFHLGTFSLKINVLNNLVIAKWSGPLSGRSVITMAYWWSLLRKFCPRIWCFCCSLICEIKNCNGLLIYRQLAALLLGNGDYFS